MRFKIAEVKKICAKQLFEPTKTLQKLFTSNRKEYYAFVDFVGKKAVQDWELGNVRDAYLFADWFPDMDTAISKRLKL